MGVSGHYRKLVAILYADVKGYSRLMGEDDASTIESLNRRRGLFKKTAEANNGRVVNNPGDSILVEFPSIVDAVSCAMDIQEKLKIVNHTLPENRRMEYRIGVTLGDVIQKNNELFGDGVNIAARVESLAPTGGVCITRQVYDQVKHILTGYTYQDLGKHTVKNIREPVWIFRISNSSLDHPDPAGTSPESSGYTSRTPVIAVLPFENFSAGQFNDYFTNGFVEDLLTDLARFKNLQVISSYSSRKISAAGNDEIQVSRDLGINYFLRGALIKRKETIRITTQLIETETGKLLWAEKYDSPLEDLFDIQDDIVHQVAGAISFQIDTELLAGSRRKPVTNLAAYEFWLQGMDLLRQGSGESDLKARALFEKALEIDPYFSRACTGLSLSHFNDWSCQMTDQWEIVGNNALKYAMKAVELDNSDHIAQLVIGRILMYRREFDLAEQHIDKSLKLNSSDADSLTKQAACKAMLGNPEAGEELFLKALRLNPYRSAWYFTYGSLTYFLQREFEKCIETGLKGPLTEEWMDLPAYIAASYAHLGDQKKAGTYLDIFTKVFKEKITGGKPPGPDDITNWIYMANPFRHKAHLDLYINGLKKAGLEQILDPSPAGYPAAPNTFKSENKVWHIVYDGKEVRIPGVKGFFDIAALMANPGKEIHCTELMGRYASFNSEEPVIDEKARMAYEKRIKDLREEIDESEKNNDLERSRKLNEELSSLADHIAKSLGLSGRKRKLNSEVEKTRTAVTWRIRSAVKKIKAVHPSLARHLNNTLATGTFCSYQPEKGCDWYL